MTFFIRRPGDGRYRRRGGVSCGGLSEVIASYRPGQAWPVQASQRATAVQQDRGQESGGEMKLLSKLVAIMLKQVINHPEHL